MCPSGGACKARGLRPISSGSLFFAPLLKQSAPFTRFLLSQWGPRPLRPGGVSNALALVLLLIGILAGAGGYYLASGPQTTRTMTVTSTVNSETSVPAQTASATMSASVVSCIYDQGDGTGVCIVTITNPSEANPDVNSCNIVFTGLRLSGTVSVSHAPVLSGNYVTATCRATDPVIPTINPGSSAAGSFGFSDGSSVNFSGTWTG
jgi:hypothetical protein